MIKFVIYVNLILNKLIVDIGTSTQIFAFEGKLDKDIYTHYRTSEVANTFQFEDQKCGN